MDIETKIEECRIMLNNFKSDPSNQRQVFTCMIEILDEMNRVVDDIRETMEI